MAKTLEICPLNNFFKGTINTLSLTVGTMSYSRSVELNHLA